jgi:hypothetical protein
MQRASLPDCILKTQSRIDLLPSNLISDPTPAHGAANKDQALKDYSKKGINRLTPEEIQSFMATVADLLEEGRTIEEVEARVAPTMHPVDWATARSTALAQVAPGTPPGAAGSSAL